MSTSLPPKLTNRSNPQPDIERLALAKALATLDNDDADVLIVAKLDRPHPYHGHPRIIPRNALTVPRWSLVILNVDTTIATAADGDGQGLVTRFTNYRYLHKHQQPASFASIEPIDAGETT